jgi:hypothetical protein
LTGSNNEEITTTTMITKTAKTDHPINELIAKRWSARAFSTRPVERSKLLSILEAARWAPSRHCDGRPECSDVYFTFVV